MKRAGGSNTSARILFFDIETAPIVGTIWQKYEANMVWSIQDWYMLCFAYKWLGERKASVVAQPDFKGYKAGSADDSKVIGELHRLFDEADIVVAHNGDQFDVKKANARFIQNKLGPPAPYQQVDTKKMAKRSFGFTSNKLDDLGEYLGVGRKITTDKGLWQGCMAGDMKSWKKMKRYNIQDVKLLEDIYLALLPYYNNHPNLASIAGRPDACPRCGAEGQMWAQGWRYTKTGKNRVFQCKSCGSKVTARKPEKREGPTYV